MERGFEIAYRKGFTDVYGGKKEKKVFGGKVYKYARTFTTKQEAEKYAKKLRKYNRARIIKGKFGNRTVYRVYYRKGKGVSERILEKKGIELS